MDIVSTIFKQDIGVFWYPFILLLILVFLIIVFKIWGRMYFSTDYNKDSDQVKPYNSGNIDEVNYSIKSSNLYWGFRKSIQSYFDRMGALHNGDLNDYIKWYVIFMGVCFLLLGGGLL